MKMRSSLRLILLPAVLSVILACKQVTPWQAEEEAAELVDIPTDIYQSPEEIAVLLDCSATQYISVEVSKTKDEVNEYKTETYEYNIHIANNHLTDTVFLVGWEHKADIYQNLDSSTWKNMGAVGPGRSVDRYVYKMIYHEKDAEGPLMRMIEKLAAVPKTESCDSQLTDESFLTKIAIPIEYP